MTIPTAYKTIPGLALLALTALPQLAEAQSVIKQPGNHPDYSVELEPHFLFQWTSRDGADDGFGPGVRLPCLNFREPLRIHAVLRQPRGDLLEQLVAGAPALPSFQRSMVLLHRLTLLVCLTVQHKHGSR